MDEFKQLLGRPATVYAPDGFAVRTMQRIARQSQAQQHRRNARHSAYMLLGAACMACGAIILVLNLTAGDTLNTWSRQQTLRQDAMAQQAVPQSTQENKPPELLAIIDNAAKSLFVKETQPK